MDPVLLIFAGLAAFVLYRLFSVLGTRTGHEQRHDLEGVQRSTRADDERAEREAQEAKNKPLQPVSPAAQPLRDADPEFDEKAYLDGARGAYEMIVEAFSAGDLKSIRRFLSDSVYDAFRAAVQARAEAGQQVELKFVGIDTAAISSAEANDRELTAVTDFASNQVRAVYNKDGEVVDGDPNRIDLVKDRWTFSRRRDADDPNWMLIATGGGV